MATLSREEIETFISFTGASEAIAVQKLQAHGADLNAAVNAYFNQLDRSSSINAHQISVSGEYDFMGIDDPVDVEPQGSPRSPLSTAREIMNPFSILDQNFRSGLFGYASDFTNSAPVVTHPRELREIPIEFRHGSQPSGQSDHLPKIEDVTGTVDAHGPEVHGTVVIDDDKEDEEPPVASRAHAPESEHPRITSNISRGRNDVSSAFESGGFQDTDDIEEEMIRAAIEASKKDVMQAYPSDSLTSHTDLTNFRTREHLSHLSEFEISPAPSSIKPEEDFPEQGQNIERSKIETSKLTEVEPRKVTALNGRMQTGSTSAPDEVEDLEEDNLVRHRSKCKSSGNVESGKGVEIDESLASSPKHPYTSNNPQHNGKLFHSYEWGGISSEEHDEAVMLEAAMFGGGSEGSSYRFPSAPHEFMRNQGSYIQPAPRPPSPSLVAQRLIREQQEDEYLVALQAADRKKELKAMAEAATILEKERQREEKSRQKLDAEKQLERHLAEIEASLPSEPRSDDENAVTLLVCMPDGSRQGRRFLRSDKLQCLFDFIDIGRVVKPGSYRLVRPYPGKAYGDGESSLTLNELELNSKQESLYLELI